MNPIGNRSVDCRGTESQSVIGTSDAWTIPIVVLGLSLAVIGGVYWSTVQGLVHMWANSVTYNHGFLIAPISLYLGWMRRHELAKVTPTINLWGALILTLVVCGWLLGRIVHVALLEHLGFVAIIPAVVLFLWGAESVRVLAFPLGFLIFAVPMGEDLIPWLQDLTSAFIVKGLQLSGVPVYIEGRVLVIPSGTWKVVESCSGIRFLFASLVCGSLIADWAFGSWRRRLVFIIVAAVFPVLANGFRAYSIVMAAHLTNNRIGVGADHLVYGWAFFGIGIALLAWMAARWQDREDNQPSILARPGTLKNHFAVCLGGLMAVAICIAGAAGATHGVINEDVTAAEGYRLEVSVSEPWKSLGVYQSDWKPHFLGAAAELTESFSDGTRKMHLYLFYYPWEREGAELISSQNIVSDHEGVELPRINRRKWNWAGDVQRTIDILGQQFVAQGALLHSGTTKRTVLVIYWVDDRFTSNKYYAKFLQIKARLFSRAAPSAALILTADYSADPSEGIDTIQSFLDHGTLPASLRQAALESSL